MKKRKKKKTLLRTFMFAMILAGVILSLFVFFKIETIEIVGDTKYNDSEILEASGLAKGDNLLRFSASARAERITTKLPYILSVKIKRNLPSKLVIEVTPVTAVAAIKTNNGYLIVNSEAKVLEKSSYYSGCVIIGPEADYDKSLPGKTVVTENRSGYDQMSILVRCLDKLSLIQKINVIDMSSPLDISFIYGGRVKATLGTVSDCDYKLEMFKEVVEKRESENFVGKIDLSKAGEATVHDGSEFIEPYRPYIA